MSTKSHFICELGIEGFSDCSEPRELWGQWVGDDVYLLIEPSVLKSTKISGQYLYVELKKNTHLPYKFKIWGDAIISADIDEDGLLIHLKGGHHITKQIVKLEFDTTIDL